MSSPDYEKLRLEELNYESYLKIPDLLRLQHQITDPPHHDEMFFIIIHQASELWFKLMLHETTVLVNSFREADVARSIKVLHRLSATMDLLGEQILLLSTLTPHEFAGFRDKLNPASGFQSLQFRKMEFAYGLRNDFFLSFFENLMPDAAAELKDIMGKPSVYDEFLFMLKKEGFAIPDELMDRDWSQPRELNQDLCLTFKKEYERGGSDYQWSLLFEAMVGFDEKLTLWRFHHMTMISRTIGQKMGTGGSTGYQFLESRSREKLFPELWEVRNLIGEGY